MARPSAYDSYMHISDIPTQVLSQSSTYLARIANFISSGSDHSRDAYWLYSSTYVY